MEAGVGFVGRDHELDSLTGALDAVATRGVLFLLAGEPGIGKSRLSDEFAEAARRGGARVLWGRCWEAGGAPAYWPWVQAIRSYLRELTDDRLSAELGSGAPDVAQMIPEIAERLEGITVQPVGDPDAARFRLFDSTATLVRNAAAKTPIVIVLEDIHAADTPSLLLLQFLAGELPLMRVVLVATYRDTEVKSGHPLEATLVELVRQPATRRLELSGFDKREVSRFIEATTERVPSDDLVSAVLQETEGNPLFVGEVVRLLAAEGRLDRAMGPTRRLGIPEGVRAVIGRRIGHLSFECSRVLELASILGQEFALDRLERLAEMPTKELVEVLDEAIGARVVAEVPSVLGRMRFSHALFRETLYNGLPVAQRMSLHKQAGEAIEASARDIEAHLAELAHHFFEAAGAGEATKALDYARRAAVRAASLIAYEEAVRLYAMAVQALDLEHSADDASRCRLLLEMGDAETRAGEAGAAKRTLLEAFELARRIGDPEMMAAAAIAYGGRFTWVREGNDPHLVRLLEDGLDALGGADHPQRVRLLARLSCALRDSHDRQRSDDLSREAVEMAERIGDTATLAYALNGRFGAIWWPENPHERLEIGARFFTLPLADKELRFDAFQLMSACHFELGDMPRVREAIESGRRLAGELRQPSQWWLADSQEGLVALMEGRYADAETSIEDYRKARHAQVDAMSAYRGQLYLLRREQGRSEEVEDLVRAAIDEFPWYPAHRCMLARLLVETGRTEEGRALYEELTVDECSVLAKDNEWILNVSLLAEICGLLNDRTRAPMLYDLLLPYRDRNAHAHLEGSLGAVARMLAILSTVVERFDDAERHFEDAIERNRLMQAQPFVAWTLHALAVMLLRRRGAGDDQRAAVAAAEARAIARDVGMVLLDERLDALGIPGEPHGGRQVPIAMGDSTDLFVREGEYWSVVHDGKPIKLRDSKGMVYIARLLANPGREVHALDLIGSDVPAAVRGRDDDLSIDPGNGIPMLDEEAKRVYRARLRELEDEAEEARSWGDEERAARAVAERDALVEQLAGAVGLGGRDRKTSSAAERARVNVTRAIKAATVRIAEQSPALGEHLDATLRTGTYCSYSPDPRSGRAWKTT
ncbi:MAG: ATP-binding protein [Actinomycetota bacterium]